MLDPNRPASDRHACFEQDVFIASRLDQAEELTRRANLHFAKQEYSNAESLYWRALAIRREVVGPHHLAVAATLDDIAELYEIQDRNLEARRFWEFALLVKERVYGSYHPIVMKCIRKLSNFYVNGNIPAPEQTLIAAALEQLAC